MGDSRETVAPTLPPTLVGAQRPGHGQPHEPRCRASVDLRTRPVAEHELLVGLMAAMTAAHPPRRGPGRQRVEQGEPPHRGYARSPLIGFVTSGATRPW